MWGTPVPVTRKVALVATALKENKLSKKRIALPFWKGGFFFINWIPLRKLVFRVRRLSACPKI